MLNTLYFTTFVLKINFIYLLFDLSPLWGMTLSPADLPGVKPLTQPYPHFDCTRVYAPRSRGARRSTGHRLLDPDPQRDAVPAGPVPVSRLQAHLHAQHYSGGGQRSAGPKQGGWYPGGTEMTAGRVGRWRTAHATPLFDDDSTV